ncbi:dinitrogenase iron-molybdenum cofactor, partial [Burkholderia pseudomallei]
PGRGGRGVGVGRGVGRVVGEGRCGRGGGGEGPSVRWGERPSRRG